MTSAWGVSSDPFTGLTDWLSVPATITLEVTDPGSGVSGTFFTVDGGERQTYSQPVVISADGITSLLYWSESSVEGGVPEQAHQIKVRVDRSSPTSGWRVVSNSSGKARLALTARDNTSGLLYVETSIDGADFERIDGLDAARAHSVTLDVTGRGTHTVRYRIVDRAINRIEGSFDIGVKGAQRVRFTGIKKTLTIKRVRGSAYFTARAQCADETGMPLAGRKLVLQRSTNGRTFKTHTTRPTTASGAVSFKVRERKLGTTYWRWYAPGDEQFPKAYSSVITVKTR